MTETTTFFAPNAVEILIGFSFIAIVLVLLWLFKKWWKH